MLCPCRLLLAVHFHCHITRVRRARLAGIISSRHVQLHVQRTWCHVIVVELRRDMFVRLAYCSSATLIRESPVFPMTHMRAAPEDGGAMTLVFGEISMGARSFWGAGV